MLEIGRITGISGASDRFMLPEMVFLPSLDAGKNARNTQRVGWAELAVGQAFQPDISVRLESLTYGERRPTMIGGNSRNGGAALARSPTRKRVPRHPACP
jgi:hypothetical protein